MGSRPLSRRKQRSVAVRGEGVRVRRLDLNADNDKHIIVVGLRNGDLQTAVM